jgi:LuxR family maltose regulon positive regulatory protein
MDKLAVQEVLARLIAAGPPSMRFLLSGRDGTGLQRGSLRARGDLREIGVRDLRFSASEAHELLPLLTTEQIDRLLARTEGWPVALQLARIWLDADPARSALLEGFSGQTSEVAEYLAEQVLGDLSPELQTILSDVALLDALNPDLVTVLTGSQQSWSRLVDDGRLDHFLVPLDEEHYWFRLHHLLLDFLRARRREHGVDGREQHSRASSWFERHGRLRDAVRHAVLAEDIPRAAALIERSGGWELVLFGGTAIMRALLRLIPANRIAEFPRMQIFHAFLAAKDGDLNLAVHLFDGVTGAVGGAASPALRRDILIVGHLIHRYTDSPVTGEELDALYRDYDALAASDDIARATLLNSACLLAFGLGDVPATLEACGRAVREMRRIGSVLGLNYCLFHLGLAQLHLGERREAEATLREAAAMAEENFGSDSGLKAIADIYLSLALHARGDIAGTAERIEASLEQVERADGWLDLYAEGYEVAIASASARGDRAAATSLVERMVTTASERRLARLERLASVFGAQLAVLAAFGPGPNRPDATAVRRILLDRNLQWVPGVWQERPSVWREHHALGVVHVLAALVLEDSAGGQAIIADLDAAARSGDRRRHLRVLAALRAALELRNRDARDVIPDFIPHLEAAVREDDTQFLVDFGPALLPLLQAAWAWSREHGISSRVRQVLAVSVTTLARAATATEVSIALSARELEVLGELAAGAPNKVIARNLQMTENTVKFHLKGVFRKLQVRHRAEALQAARTRGLLR